MDKTGMYYVIEVREEVCERDWWLRPSKKPRGRPQTTYLQEIKTQLKEKHFQTLEDAMMEAKDREKWRAIVKDRSFLADNGHQ